MPLANCTDAYAWAGGPARFWKASGVHGAPPGIHSPPGEARPSFLFNLSKWLLYPSASEEEGFEADPIGYGHQGQARCQAESGHPSFWQGMGHQPLQPKQQVCWGWKNMFDSILVGSEGHIRCLQHAVEPCHPGWDQDPMFDKWNTIGEEWGTYCPKGGSQWWRHWWSCRRCFPTKKEGQKDQMMTNLFIQYIGCTGKNHRKVKKDAAAWGSFAKGLSGPSCIECKPMFFKSHLAIQHCLCQRPDGHQLQISSPYMSVWCTTTIECWCHWQPSTMAQRRDTIAGTIDLPRWRLVKWASGWETWFLDCTGAFYTMEWLPCMAVQHPGWST